VRDLFDQYASSFDDHLQQRLGYKVPSQLRSLLDARHEERRSLTSLLDMGCGTGLTGEVFADLVEELTGVDLSERMIHKSRLKGICDALVVADVVEYLNQPGPAFGLFVACDVFIYLGDLLPAFRGMARRAAPGATALFSTETLQNSESVAQSGVCLGQSGRFSHSAEHVLNAAEATGWQSVERLSTTLRVERGVAVAGDLYVMSRPA